VTAVPAPLLVMTGDGEKSRPEVARCYPNTAVAANLLAAVKMILGELEIPSRQVEPALSISNF